MKSRLGTMIKIAFGALLVLMVAAPISASPITQLQIDELNTILVSPNVDALLSSIDVNAGLTIGFDATTVWTDDSDATGDLGAGEGCDSTAIDGGVGCQLIVSFNSPQTLVGFEGSPNNDADGGISVTFWSGLGGTGTQYVPDFQSATSSQLLGSDTGYWFFGAQESGGIGSVVVTTSSSGPDAPDAGGLYAADFQFLATSTPEPSTFLLLAAGLFGLGLVSRRRLAR